MSALAMKVRHFKRPFWDQDCCYLWTTDGRGRRVLVCYRNRAELRRWLSAQSLIRRSMRREVQSNDSRAGRYSSGIIDELADQRLVGAAVRTGHGGRHGSLVAVARHPTERTTAGGGGRTVNDYPVRVLTKDELRAWRDGVRGAAAQAAKLAECGYVPLAFLNDGWFTWLCPGCGYFSHGRVGEQPVGGWDEPRWTVTGLLPDHLTLQPSLGCPRWRDGTCTGHWWCRDGELVSAEVANGG